MRADGSEFPAELAITRIEGDGEPTFAGHLRDITDRHRAERDLRAARRRVIEAADGERRRIARDLHDGAQQQLVAVALNLELAREQLAAAAAGATDGHAPPVAGHDPLAAARELIEAALSEVRAATVSLRELVAGIHPAILTHRGLAAAVASLAGRLTLPVDVRELPEGRLPASVEAGAYFFVCEALTNVVRHAHASHATVRAAVADGHLLVTVADDGVGDADAARGSGLTGLGDRVAALEGSFSVHSRHGEGTTLTCRLPLGRHAVAT